jgi:hypothetical protein
MRLQKYIEYAPLSKEINTFRAMSIKLVDKPKDYSPVIEAIKESHQSISKVDDILKRINIELRAIYNGNCTLALCLDENAIRIKIKDRYMDKLKELLYSSNSELVTIKEAIEQK